MPEKNRRTSERDYTYAKLVFHDNNTIGYIRDLSAHGLRAELISAQEEQPRQGVTLTIIPTPELKLDPFNIEASIRWSNINGPTVSVGLHIETFATETGKQIFHRLCSLMSKAQS